MFKTIDFYLCASISISRQSCHKVPQITWSSRSRSSWSCCRTTATLRWPSWCSRGLVEWWTSLSSSSVPPSTSPPDQSQPTSTLTSWERRSQAPPSPAGCKRCRASVRLWTSWKIIWSFDGNICIGIIHFSLEQYWDSNSWSYNYVANMSLTSFSIKRLFNKTIAPSPHIMQTKHNNLLKRDLNSFTFSSVIAGFESITFESSGKQACSSINYKHNSGDGHGSSGL